MKSQRFIDPSRRALFHERFAANGIATERVELRTPQPDMMDHLNSYAEIDIALDPFPYNGTTTTCEALWMGVPMVSLIADHHAARVGFDLLSQVGIAEFAAPDIDRYVATAIALAGDLPQLTELGKSCAALCANRHSAMRRASPAPSKKVRAQCGANGVPPRHRNDAVKTGPDIGGGD